MIWALRNLRFIAAVAALAGLLYGPWWLRGYVEKIDDLRASNAALMADLKAARETADVMRAHNARLDKEAAARAKLIDHLKSMEGQDAPLSDLLSAAAAGLWP